jgi:hypothetical protein
MDGLEVLNLEIHIAPCHVERTVTQDALEPKYVASVANVVHRECMPQCVKAESYSGGARVHA